MTPRWLESLPDVIRRANNLYCCGCLAEAREAYLQAATQARWADLRDIEDEMLNAAEYCNNLVHDRPARESWA